MELLEVEKLAYVVYFIGTNVFTARREVFDDLKKWMDCCTKAGLSELLRLYVSKKNGPTTQTTGKGDVKRLEAMINEQTPQQIDYAVRVLSGYVAGHSGSDDDGDDDGASRDMEQDGERRLRSTEDEDEDEDEEEEETAYQVRSLKGRQQVSRMEFTCFGPSWYDCILNCKTAAYRKDLLTLYKARQHGIRQNTDDTYVLLLQDQIWSESPAVVENAIHTLTRLTTTTAADTTASTPRAHLVTDRAPPEEETPFYSKKLRPPGSKLVVPDICYE